MGSNSRTLEITIVSCEDLRINRRSIKKSTYVTVRTDHLNYRNTSLDTEGGSYPMWNQKITIDMPLHEPFLTLEVHHKLGSGDRIIGSTRMPVSDFTGGYLPDNYLNFLSYRLRDGKGERNGIINVSVKVQFPPGFSTPNNKVVLEHCDACPTTSASKPQLALASDGERSFGPVTGIPVWTSHPI